MGQGVFRSQMERVAKLPRRRRNLLLELLAPLIDSAEKRAARVKRGGASP